MKHVGARQLALGIIGAVGALVFSFVFALTFHTPEWVERFAAEFIEREVARQVDRRIDALQLPAGEGGLSRLAASMYERNQAEIERRRESLRSKAHEQMAAAIAQMRDLGCECRAQWSERLREGSMARIQHLERANESLERFIHATYAHVVDGLKRDIRIFSGANASMFLLLLAVAFLKPQAVLQLFVPGVLLAVATLICAWFYVFEQNWLLTIIYSNYLGLAYLGYLGLVFGLLCDIVLNRARVTTRVVNGVLNAVGSAASAVAC